MNILLAGGHHDTNFLVKDLKANGHELMVVHEDSSWCQMIADKHEVMAVCGDASDAHTLELARADRMDVVIALYELDAKNLIICELAKNQFHVNQTYAIVNDPKNAGLFKRFGVDECINTVALFCRMIEQQAVEENIRKHLPTGDHPIKVYDIVLSGSAPSINKKLWEIGFPPESIVACIQRDGETIIPKGNTILLAGDKAIIISSVHAVDSVLALLSGKTKKS
ncbi:MAG: potassium channel family protein [Saccharofermentanales bacterium]